MIRALLSVIALTASISLAHSHTAPRIEIYEHGIYTSGTGYPRGLSAQGLVEYGIDRIDLVESTGTVVAQIGVQFGFRYRLIGYPRNQPVELTYVMKMPEPGIVAPGKSRAFTRDEFKVLAWPTGDRFRLWSLDLRSDLVPGLWTFEIWCEGKKLAEQTFNVILPPIA